MLLGTLPSIFDVQRSLDFLKVQSDTLVKELEKKDWFCAGVRAIMPRFARGPVKNRSRLA